MLTRLEGPLLFGFAVLWLEVLIDTAGYHFLAGRVDLGLYHFFAFAAVLGWLAGNFFTVRRRLFPEPSYRSYLLAAWLGGPPSLLFLLHNLVPRSAQQQQPMVPVWALGVFLLFFVLPVSLERRR